jgi:uncharacterized surface protein with fasciclin (FAS1) repeats
MISTQKIVAATLALVALTAYANGVACPDADKTIVEIAAGNDDFSTLVAAAQAAGLVDALNGEGPLNVFAPTNEAFEIALQTLGITVEQILGQTELLAQILSYHVVADGAVCTGSLSGDVPTLLPGYDLKVEGDTVTDGLGSTATIQGTVPASNGQIFIIDRVLLPELPGSSAPSGDGY